jgi:hypothetical protein
MNNSDGIFGGPGSIVATDLSERNDMGSYKVRRMYAPAAGLGVEGQLRTLNENTLLRLTESQSAADNPTPFKASNLMLAGAVAGAGVLAFIVAKSLKK